MHLPSFVINIIGLDFGLFDLIIKKLQFEIIIFFIKAFIQISGCQKALNAN